MQQRSSEDGLAQTRAGASNGTWLSQFPAPLIELALIRLVSSLGAGGVLYLTPLVFHQARFSPSSVTMGVALAALAGALGRLLSGLLLDRGSRCSLPVLLAIGTALAGDWQLLGASGFADYLQGQLLMGIAMGLYWPAIELAVPLSCVSGPAPVPSARGYALARIADASGIASGALIGAVLASGPHLRGIYLLDMVCLGALALLLVLRPLPQPPQRLAQQPARWRNWLPPLLPLLGITLVATAVPPLMQSVLPLDLVRGGLARQPLPTSLGALLIGLQLGLLVLIQWPVGQALARRGVAVGLRLSMVCLALGTLLLAGSGLLPQGIWLALLAQLPLALGQAAFLPIATEAVIEVTPSDHQGLAMALFSQCFAISACGAPLLAGLALERQGHGSGLWLTMAGLFGLGLALVGRLRPRTPG